MSFSKERIYSFCKREWSDFSGKETITFFHGKDSEIKYEKESYDWYIITAIEKCDLIKENRELITRELVLSYRWAIREGFNHMLDSSLKNRFDRPRNRNTIQGVQKYIELIKKKANYE